MNKKGKINKIIKFSNVDGPGNRLSIFFQGCNFNCGYCHNPETINICKDCLKCVETCPTGALKNLQNKIQYEKSLCIDCDICTRICGYDSTPKCHDYNVSELLDEIDKVKSFIKGVTVSGGESTLQYDFITQLFIEIKNRWKNLDCFVDTNGGVNLREKKYQEFVKQTDFFMLDVKSWSDEEHLKLTGVSNKNVVENLKFLKEIGKLYEVRTVVFKTEFTLELEENKNTIENVSKIISGCDIKYKIIKYREFGVRGEEKQYFLSPNKTEMNFLKDIAMKNGISEDTIIII